VATLAVPLALAALLLQRLIRTWDLDVVVISEMTTIGVSHTRGRSQISGARS
jgi:hypothetical protein